jgi:FkbM family methyltransferase
MLKPYELRLLIPPPVKNILRVFTYASLFSEYQSIGRFYRVFGARRRAPNLPERVDLKIRCLRHNAITIRTRGTDARVVFRAFFHKFHVPPAGAMESPTPLIFDLGANIGCTMAHFACLYPGATIVGVEMDKSNTDLCKANVAPWGDRCLVVEGAIWYEDGEVKYEHGEGIEDGYSVSVAPGLSERTVTAQAFSLNSLVDRFARDRKVDFMKMDIEGAEKLVLSRNTEWAASVNAIKVELHGEYTIDQCIADLSALGFDAWADTNQNLCVVGVRAGKRRPGTRTADPKTPSASR